MFRKRQTIYSFLLTHMTDEQKFNLCGKLSHEVLGAFVDETLPFNNDSSAILVDSLTVLASKVFTIYISTKQYGSFFRTVGLFVAGNQAEFSAKQERSRRG